jgi:hypothetical protein
MKKRRICYRNLKGAPNELEQMELLEDEENFY